jgi:hypothetical protein
MRDFDVEISDTRVVVTHTKYKHKWLFPRTPPPHYIGAPTVDENQKADRGTQFFLDDARRAAKQELKKHGYIK